MKWLEGKLGFIPLFEGPASVTGRTMLVAGLVLTVMILPIVSAVARKVFSQTPRKLQEGALALGATRWEMLRMTVLPFGKSSIISGAMLGLGRALGETMAVTIILSVSGIVTFNLISQANPSTIAANVALDFPESTGLDDQHPDRLRPRPLRDHPGHQPRRAGDHRPRRTCSSESRSESGVPCQLVALGRRRRRLAPCWALRRCLLAAGSPSASARRCFSIVFTVCWSRSVVTYAWSRRVEGPRRAKDRLITLAIVAAFGLALIPLLSLIFEVAKRGIPGLSIEFLTESARGQIGGGGAAHALVGTLVITGVAALISIPIGLMAAIYLTEYGGGRLGRALTFFVDVMTGIPSIVAGLFAYALFALFLGPGIRLGVMGSVALSVLMIPIVIRNVRGDAEDRPQPPARSLLRAGNAEVADDHQGRPADRLRRPDHRHDDRRRPDHRRDGAAAGHHRRGRLDQQQPLLRPHAEPRGLRLQRVPNTRRLQAGRRTTEPGQPR